MAVISESVVEVNGTHYKFSTVNYTSSASSTFLVDQNAVSVAVTKPTSNQPSVSIGTSDGNFEKTVTIAAGGASGPVTVVTTHSGTPGGVKPAVRT